MFVGHLYVLFLMSLHGMKLSLKTEIWPVRISFQIISHLQVLGIRLQMYPFESHSSAQTVMIKLDILFSKLFYCFAPSLFPCSYFYVYVKTHYDISYLQNYFRIGEYPKLCSFFFRKREKAFKPWSKDLHFSTVLECTLVLLVIASIIFLKSLKFLKVRQIHLG